jgi:hypothetical protein
MKLVINTTLFNLIEVVTHIPQAVTMSLCESLRASRDSFVEGRKFLIENTFEFGENVENITQLDLQIDILNKNIKTLEDALLCHESKCIEKRLALKDLQKIGLN